MSSLNIEQLKDDFQKDGYIFLQGFLSKEEVAEIDQRLRVFIADRLSELPPAQVMYEDKNDKSTLKQLQDLDRFDSFFNDILNNSKFTRIAEELLGEKVIGKTFEYFNKPPKIGKPTPPHQDGYYFMLKPVSAVTMWMALEDVDEKNGCVRYVKGSHLKGMREHGRTQTLGFSQQIIDYGREGDNEIPFPAKPGDLLIHHALTIHRADGNQSENRTRKAIGLIYWGESAKEDTEAKAAYQKKLAEELSVKA